MSVTIVEVTCWCFINWVQNKTLCRSNSAFITAVWQTCEYHPYDVSLKYIFFYMPMFYSRHVQLWSIFLVSTLPVIYHTPIIIPFFTQTYILLHIFCKNGVCSYSAYLIWLIIRAIVVSQVQICFISALSLGTKKYILIWSSLLGLDW